MNVETITQIETSTTIFKLFSNGVGHMDVKPGIVMDIPAQMENLVALNEITKSQHTPFIVTAGENATVTLEARKNAIKIEKISPMFGTGIVVTNLAHRLIAEFYYKVHRPIHPYKIFKDLDSAMDWCVQFVKNPN